MSRENIDFLFYVCWPHYDVQTKLKNIKIQFSISIFFLLKKIDILLCELPVASASTSLSPIWDL